MFSLKSITNDQAYSFFMEDPKLAYMALPDDVLAGMYNDKKFYTSEGSELLGIYDKEELFAILKYELWTDICINIHIYLQSKYHHQGKTADLWEFAEGWLAKNNPKITKMVTLTPASCAHVIPVVKRYGFKEEGRITQSVTWRQEVVDLLIFGRSLN